MKTRYYWQMHDSRYYTSQKDLHKLSAFCIRKWHTYGDRLYCEIDRDTQDMGIVTDQHLKLLLSLKAKNLNGYDDLDYIE